MTLLWGDESGALLGDLMWQEKHVKNFKLKH